MIDVLAELLIESDVLELSLNLDQTVTIFDNLCGREPGTVVV
jgi:hypothetical protein